MKCDRSIPSGERHIAALSFSKILKHAVRPVSVGIAVGQTRLASDDDHDRVFRRRNYSALLLTIKTLVNISAANIAATWFKPIRHCGIA